MSQSNLVKYLVAFENSADGLIRAAETILGGSSGFRVFPVAWKTNPGEIIKKLQQQIDGEGSETSVLILTDLIGATPANVALTVRDGERVEVVTGVNLSMIIKAVTLPGSTPLDEAAKMIAEKGRSAIEIGSEMKS